MILLVLSLALSPVQAYNLGNKLYAQRDFTGAAQAYTEALRQGPSALATYNLGNALFKGGKIGLAILNYRRAEFLAPRDPDIAANLAFARNYRVDKVLAAPSPFAEALGRAFHWLSLREATLLAALAFTLMAASLAIWIVRRWMAFLAAAAVFAVLALLAFITQQVWSGEHGAHPAVVVVSEVNALSGPGEDSKQILELHDGTEVHVRETRSNYLLVQLPGGTGGWIPKGAVEPVF